MADFKYGEITEKIIGHAFRVHNTLGRGFQEVIYQRALQMEFNLITKIDDTNIAQAINYLEAYNLEIGLLINFGSKRMEFDRFTNKKYKPGIIHHPAQSRKSQ